MSSSTGPDNEPHLIHDNRSLESVDHARELQESQLEEALTPPECGGRCDARAVNTRSETSADRAILSNTGARRGWGSVRGALLPLLIVVGLSSTQAEAADGFATELLQYKVVIAEDAALVRAQNASQADVTAISFALRHGSDRLQTARGERIASTAQSAGQLGYSVALDGDHAIAGAEWQGGFEGAAYVFERRGSGWGEPQELVPSDLGRLDHFGSAVAIDGDHAVVGAPWHNLLSGAVYVFKRVGDEWVELQKLTSPDGGPDERFGLTVRFEGDDVVVGSGSRNSTPLLEHRYRLDTWRRLDVTDASRGATTLGLDRLVGESATASDLFAVTDIVWSSMERPPALQADPLPAVARVMATDAVFEDRVEVNWESVDRDAIVYRIERNGVLLSLASSDDVLYADTTGDPATVYEYCVIVSDMMGGVSPKTCDDGSRILFAPELVTASDGNYDQFVRVSWTDVSTIEAGYIIERDNTEIGRQSANATVFNDSTAVPETVYQYDVITFDSEANESEPAGDDGFRGVILPPLAVTASYGEYADHVRITWIDQAGKDKGYNIYRDDVPDAPIGSVPVDSESYEDSTAVSGVVHSYCVTTKGTGSIESIRICDEGGIDILPPPTNVSASDSTFDDRVEITWEDPSDLESGFEVWRDGSLLGTTSANATLYKDRTALPDTEYEYCVVAVSSEGGRSTGICDSGLQSIVLAAFDVQATDGALEERVDLTWECASTTVVLFKILRDGDFVKSVGGGERSWSDFDCTAGLPYDYSVTAVTGGGAESDPRVDAGHRALHAPTNVQASDEEYENKVVVSWTDNSDIESGYVIFRQDTMTAVVDTIRTWSSSSNTFTDKTAVSRVTYWYGVAAFDTLGDAWGRSAMETDIGRRLLLAPTNVLATDDEFEDRVEITWQDNSNAEDGYWIYRSGVLADSTVDNFTSYVDTPPDIGQTYEYSIVAFDAFGESDPDSDAGSATILAPASFNASDTYTDAVELTWVDRSEIEHGYIILRDGVEIATTAIDATFHTDTEVISDGPHQYCIRSFVGGVSSIEVCETGERVQVAATQTVQLEVKIPGANGGGGFGKSVAMSGDVAIVGAHADAGTGAAYVVHSARGEWIQTAELRAVDAEAGAWFGYCVDIDGDVAIVGAPEHSETGAAYVFNFDGGEWVQTTQLNPPSAGAAFGRSVAIDGDMAMVGAPRNDGGAGSAYVFTLVGDSWEQTEELTTAVATNAFGQSVALDDDVATIGDPESDNGAGAAYLFSFANSAWGEPETLIEPEPAPGHAFGTSVSIDGDEAIVGVPGDDSAYIFIRDGSGWVLSGTLKPEARLAIVDLRVEYNNESPPDPGWTKLDVDLNGNLFIVHYPPIHLWFKMGRDDGSEGIPIDRIYTVNTTDGEDDPHGGECAGGITADCLDLNKGAGGDFIYLYYTKGLADPIRAIMVESIESDGPTRQRWGPAEAGVWYEREDLTWCEQRCCPPGQRQDLDEGVASLHDIYIGYIPNHVRDFGATVAIIGDAALVGAPGDDQMDRNAGAAYVFRRGAKGAWTASQKLAASDPQGEVEFGSSVALGANVAIAGAPWADGELGAVYLSTPPGEITATDGTLRSRVRVEWHYPAVDADEFHVYRNDSLLASVATDVGVYDDFDAQPGRTYAYSVVAHNAIHGDLGRVEDFGWRPPNGSITGRVSTRAGAGVAGISVALDPQPTRALLLDGTGGHVHIRDFDQTFAFGQARDFTVEAWFKYSGAGGSGASNAVLVGKGVGGRYPFVISNLRGENQAGRLVFGLSDGTSPINVQSQRGDLNDDVWHHVACVHDATEDELRLYIDGVLEGSTAYTTLGNVANDADITLGDASRSRERSFGGQLDELRIWNVARKASAIDSTKSYAMVGEPNLVGYWPLDGGVGSTITDLTEGAHYGVLEGGAYWTDNAAPLDLAARTDAEGNYALANIRYGDETPFKVKPEERQRQFEPAFKTITLSTGNPVENQVNFVEISSFTVAGRITYAGTECPVPDVEIVVDDHARAATDKRGKFAVSVSNGGHTIRPELAGHGFSPEEVVFEDVLGDVAGIVFQDTTLRALSGRVGGGCDHFVGDVVITLRSENNCLSETIRTDSEYRIDLPPQKYLVSAAVDEQSIPDGLIQSDVIRFFERLGEREVDLTTENAILDFIYRAPLQVTIRGLQDWIPGDCTLTYQGRTLPPSIPVIPQGTELDLVVEVNEVYGNGVDDTCRLDSGTVVIVDEIFDQEDNPFELEIRDGEALYPTFATTPNLAVGRVDGDGMDRSLQKALRAIVHAEGRTPVTRTEWALVTGHVAPEGAEFVSGKSTEVPLCILRDPPGDGSFAYFEKGHTLRTTVEFDVSAKTKGLGLNFELKWGINETAFVGMSVGFIHTFRRQGVLRNNFMVNSTTHKDRRTEVTVTADKRYSTSPSELFVGEPGDVFIGTAFNFLFAEVGVLELEGCEIKRSKAYGFQPDSLDTFYAYTEHHIRDALIPRLDSLVAYYQRRADDDSVQKFQEYRDNWQSMLDDNLRLKREANTYENRSFSAGADYEYSHEVDSTRSYVERKTIFIDEQGEAGVEWDIKTEGAITVPWKYQHEDVTSVTDTTGTFTSKVGYLLSDTDIGDYFTVNIKRDGQYPTPVFDVLAGISSCPWEPWPDPDTGEPRMIARDGPRLTMGGDSQLFDVPPDEEGAFTLNLTNLSGSQEMRRYNLDLVNTTNPGGAVVKINGAPLTDYLPFFIDPGQTQEVTLTVGRGPTRYRYKNLGLILYPPCEFSIWERYGPLQLADTLYCSIEFEAPCSDIALFRPESGWTYTREDQDGSLPLELILTDYELAISEDDSVQYVGVQYRRLGTGRQGPDEWMDIIADSVGVVGETGIVWTPPDSLKDGVYELRAFTHCGTGRGFSAVSTGTIDRNEPLVLGSPEPADGVLSLGEDISITFNEAIDCAGIAPENVTLEVLESPDTWVEVDSLHVTCAEGGSIALTPVAPSFAQLEDQTLRATVAGVQDGVGNPSDVTTWTFVVRQAAFAWAEESVLHDAGLRTPGSFTVDLVNGSEQDLDFTLEDVPTFLSAGAHPDSVRSGEAVPIEFSFEITDPTLLGTTLEDNVVAVARDANGNEIARTELAIRLDVGCQLPPWNVNPNRYEHTMTIVAQLSISGEPSLDANDVVSAFVGNEVRGTAHPGLVNVAGTDEYLVFLTTYSNLAAGETVRFRIWDRSDCRRYTASNQVFRFEADKTFGSINEPILLEARDAPTLLEQAIALDEGWTWFSLNLKAALEGEMSPPAVLGNVNARPGDVIKAQDGRFSQFDAGVGWVGTLTQLDNRSTYLLRVAETGTILHQGNPVLPSLTPVPVGQGWNWIGYVPQEPLGIEQALANLDRSDGDLLKSQFAFAQYDEITQTWVGSLAMMEPGLGYKLHLHAAAPDSLRYPDPTVVVAVNPGRPLTASDLERGRLTRTSPAVAGDAATRVVRPQTSAALGAVSAQAGGKVAAPRRAVSVLTGPDWSVDPRRFQHNMTITAELLFDDGTQVDESYHVAARVGDEVRGATHPLHVAQLERCLVFLMVYSDEARGDFVTFQVYDPVTDEIVAVLETVEFDADQVIGAVATPFVLNARREPGTNSLPTAFALGRNFPNPFRPSVTDTRIRYALPSRQHVLLRVFDVRGRVVKTLVNKPEQAGWHEVSFSGRDIPSGVYLYRIEAGEFRRAHRMIILK
jgi:hypothetical protein